MTMGSRAFQYEPLESNRHIRLVKLVVSNCGDAEPQSCSVSLIHVSLDAAPPFEAVSYVWGDLTLNCTLRLSTLCGPTELAITHSVFEAFPYLVECTTEKTNHLWIDQLCIDQSNLEERDWQVKLMGEIYSSALRTIIWLGPEQEEQRKLKEQNVKFSGQNPMDRDEDGHRHHNRIVEKPQMQHLIEAMQLADHYVHTTNPRIFNKSLIEIMERFVRECSPDEFWIKKCIGAVQSLLQRPWFERGWVFQEYVLSKCPHIIVGSRPFTLDSLMHLILLISNFGFISEVQASFDRLVRLEQSRRWRLEHAHDIYGRFDGFTFCRILSQVYSGNSLFTSDLRDRIYAFLGLWSPPNFTPDYRASITEVYTLFTRQTISATQSLEIITTAGDLDDPKLVGLPSWVPDWTNSNRNLSLLLDQELHNKVRWDAAKGLAHVQDAYSLHDRLHVHGKVIDAVEKCAEMGIHVKDEELPWPGRQCSAKRPTWQEFLRGTENIEFWSFMKPEELLRVLLTLQAGGDEKESIKRGVAECVALFEQHIIRKDTTDTKDEKIKLKRFPTDLAGIIYLWSNRMFAQTALGRFGVVPPGTQEGDMIAILHGCRVPIVLRTREESATYQLVGDAFIEDVMFGEVRTWKESEADDLILI